MKLVDVSALFSEALGADIDWDKVHRCIVLPRGSLFSEVAVLLAAMQQPGEVGDGGLYWQVNIEPHHRSSMTAMQWRVVSKEIDTRQKRVVYLEDVAMDVDIRQVVAEALQRLIAFGKNANAVDGLLQTYKDVDKTIELERAKQYQWHFKKAFA